MTMDESKPAAGRQRLIDATLDCLSEHGYHGSSLRMIARAGGVTAGLVRRHFNAKTELMIEAYRHYKRYTRDICLAEAENAGPDPPKRLEAFVSSILYFSYDEDRRHMKIWAGFLELVLSNPDASVIQRENLDLLLDELAGDVTSIFSGRGEAISADAGRSD